MGARTEAQLKEIKEENAMHVLPDEYQTLTSLSRLPLKLGEEGSATFWATAEDVTEIKTRARRIVEEMKLHQKNWNLEDPLRLAAALIRVRNVLHMGAVYLHYCSSCQK